MADNGSSDGTPALLATPIPGLRLRSVRVDEPGKGRALNAALRIAVGPLIVLTDDDVEPAPDWLAALAEGAARFPDAVVFGGRVEVNREAVPRWILRSHNLMGLLTSEHRSGGGPDGRYGFGRYPYGPNLAVRRERLARTGVTYPETMGPGTPLPVGDESAFLMQLSPPEARDRCFLPEAVVHHEVEAENVRFATALRRSWAQGRAQGTVGIPAVEPARAAGGEGREGPGGRRKSFLRAVADRVAACRSVREFVCVVVRHLGYLSARRSEP